MNGAAGASLRFTLDATTEDVLVDIFAFFRISRTRFLKNLTHEDILKFFTLTKALQSTDFYACFTQNSVEMQLPLNSLLESAHIFLCKEELIAIERIENLLLKPIDSLFCLILLNPCSGVFLCNLLRECRESSELGLFLVDFLAKKPLELCLIQGCLRAEDDSISNTSCLEDRIANCFESLYANDFARLFSELKPHIAKDTAANIRILFGAVNRCEAAFNLFFASFFETGNVDDLRIISSLAISLAPKFCGEKRRLFEEKLLDFVYQSVLFWFYDELELFAEGFEEVLKMARSLRQDDTWQCFFIDLVAKLSEILDETHSAMLRS